jgi:hypothetical protein
MNNEKRKTRGHARRRNRALCVIHYSLLVLAHRIAAASIGVASDAMPMRLRIMTGWI